MLGSKIMSAIAVPFSAVLGGLSSLTTSFLSGNWVGVIFHPLTMVAIGGIIMTGWAYEKGRTHERRAQAQAILAINEDLASWRKAYEGAEKAAEDKLKASLDGWRRSNSTSPAVVATCRLPKGAATTIAEIAGD